MFSLHHPHFNLHFHGMRRRRSSRRSRRSRRRRRKGEER